MHHPQHWQNRRGEGAPSLCTQPHTASNDTIPPCSPDQWHLGAIPRRRESDFVPVGTGRPASSTALEQVLQTLPEQQPLLKHVLRWVHDEFVVSSVTRFRQTVDAVTEKQARAHRSITSENLLLMQAIEQARETQRLALKQAETALAVAQEEAAQAVRMAAVAIALTGYAGDSTTCTPEKLLRPASRPLDVIAGDIKLPFNPSTKRTAVSKEITSWCCTCIIGVVMGISLGIWGRVLYPSALTRHPGILGGCGGIGLGIAFSMKRPVSFLWGRVGTLSALGSSPIKVLLASIVALFWSTSIVLLEALIEQQGLLSVRNLQEGLNRLSGTPTTTSLTEVVSTWAAPLIISLPAVLAMAVDGFSEGHRTAVHTLLRAQQDAETAQKIKARAEDPTFLTALTQLAVQETCQAQVAALTAQVAHIRAAGDRQIALLKTQKQHSDASISTDDVGCIAVARDEMYRTQRIFNGWLSQVLLSDKNILGFVQLRMLIPPLRTIAQRFWWALTSLALLLGAGWSLLHKRLGYP